MITDLLPQRFDKFQLRRSMLRFADRQFTLVTASSLELGRALVKFALLRGFETVTIRVQFMITGNFVEAGELYVPCVDEIIKFWRPSSSRRVRGMGDWSL